MRKKISLIGAGNIGGTLAHLFSLKELGDVVIYDVIEGVPQGKALDISQSAYVSGNDVNIIGTNSFEDTKDSDVVIITAGVARKPGMSRDDLVSINAKIICDVSKKIKKYSPKAFVVVVTNPLDAMVWIVHKETGFPANRVVGMAGVLDSSRYASFLSEALNVSMKDIRSFVLGGHGDTMVPMLNYTTIGGIPIKEYLKMGWISEEKLSSIVERTKNGGAEVVELLKTGSAFYAPAASVVEMVESHLLDKRRILPCAAYLKGEYGVRDLYVGVPVVIGKNGVEKIIEVSLDSSEKKLFNNSVEAVKKLINMLKELKHQNRSNK